VFQVKLAKQILGNFMDLIGWEMFWFHVILKLVLSTADTIG
jgi:hypothetical protein